MRCDIFQLNTDFLINQLKRYLYTRDFKPLLHFTKVALSITEVFTNIHLLYHFYSFSQSVLCAKLQINTKILASLQNIYIFTKHTLSQLRYFIHANKLITFSYQHLISVNYLKNLKSCTSYHLSFFTITVRFYHKYMLYSRLHILLQKHYSARKRITIYAEESDRNTDLFESTNMRSELAFIFCFLLCT